MKERRRNSRSPSAAESNVRSKLSGKGGIPRRPSNARKGGCGCVSFRAAGFVALIGLVLVLGAAGAAFVYWNGGALFSAAVVKPRAITPLPVPRVTDLKQFQGEHRERLFWGTYRPHLYLGIRSRTPQSLLAGLMWIGAKDGRYALRHTCEESDKLTRYSWLRHDGATYGRQELLDQGLVVSTSFLKSKENGSGYGGDWAVHIRVEEDEAQPTRKTEEQHQTRLGSVFFYVAEEVGRELKFWPEGANMEEAPFVGGFADEIGEWQLHAKYKEGVNMNYVGIRHLQMDSLDKPVWSTLEMQARTRGVLQLPDSSEKNSNMAVIQLTGTVPFELDVVFVSGLDNKIARVQSRIENLTGAALQKRLVKKEQEFEERFQETFKLHEKVENEKELEVAKIALSNMVGGIGYFYGQSRVAIPPEYKEPQSEDLKYWLYWPAELYSAVPSRPFFPRGFLWDEGFHQLLISRWDRNISLDIIGHWLDLMNIDGWIPREQILGAEARSKVPEEFITQYTSNANPPVLLLVLSRLASDFRSDQSTGQPNEEELQYFKTIFPRLEAWFTWFNTTQIGKQAGTYYWHGRDPDTDRELNPKTLTSGLDDYPRASHPSDDERHVDLWCWMAQAAKTMALIADIAGEPHEKYDVTAGLLTNLTRLNEMHFDHESGRYYDYGNHTDKVKLRWHEHRDPSTGFVQKSVRRAVLKHPKLDWVPHFGYVSFFPFAMRIIPHDSPIIGHHLEMLHNHQLLWTDYGLRSLATNSAIYMKKNTEHDAPYWRGPIWINMNYLILSALHEYATVEGPYRKTAAIIYQQLRQNLIRFFLCIMRAVLRRLPICFKLDGGNPNFPANLDRGLDFRNIVEEYYESGFLWENYSGAAKGKGQGSHPFTGWTSLVLLIMGEMY